MSELVDLLNQYQVPNVGPPHRHVRSGWWGVPCPFCEGPGGTKYRLGFEIATGRVTCWVCGLQSGPKVFQVLFRVSEKEAKALWYSLPKSTLTRAPLKTAHLLKNPPGVGDLLPAHRKYLENRGFDVDDLIKIWNIKGIGLASRLQWRIFIPIFDPYGRQVSWTTRSIAKNAERRYISASEEEEAISHKSILYGEHLAHHTILINEGPLDAQALGPGGVATLGVNYSEAQFSAMTKFPVRGVCFDNTEDAQRRARKLCRELSQFPGTTENVIIESGKDTAEADKEEIKEIRMSFGLI